jgi:hypothetical protein
VDGEKAFQGIASRSAYQNLNSSIDGILSLKGVFSERAADERESDRVVLPEVVAKRCTLKIHY